MEQIPLLETMSPQDFLEFRTLLTPASGFQSVQFREVEFLSGLKEPKYLEDVSGAPEELERLARRLDEPTLWDGFCSLMAERGFLMPGEDAERRLASLVAMAQGDRELFAVSEGLLDHDEAVAEWRFRHVLMVEREIGAKRGTGGSSGVGYLRSTLDKRFFPELWGLRSHL